MQAIGFTSHWEYLKLMALRGSAATEPKKHQKHATNELQMGFFPKYIFRNGCVILSDFGLSLFLLQTYRIGTRLRPSDGKLIEPVHKNTLIPFEFTDSEQ